MYQQLNQNEDSVLLRVLKTLIDMSLMFLYAVRLVIHVFMKFT